MALFTALLVDDDEWALQGAANTFPLQEMGFDLLLKTTDPLEAADCICAKRPDLIIADIRMPEMSGLDLLRIAREQNPACAFVLLTGFSEFSYAQQAISLGAFEYCLKPLKPQNAREVLQKAAVALRERQGGVSEPVVENESFRALLSYIEQHFTEPLRQRELCEMFDLHPSYCSRLFAKELGHGFSEYITWLRMEKAKQLLLAGEHTVAQVADLCGYRDYYYFTKVYTRRFGISPARAKKAAAHAKP